MAIQGSARKRLSTIVFAEPISLTTERKRRALLITSCASILLVVYGVRIEQTPWLKLEVPSGAPNILHGALSIALLYTFIVFIVYALTDLRRWFSSGDFIRLHNYFDLIRHAREDLNAIGQWLDKDLPTDEKKRASVQSIHDNAEEFLRTIQQEISAIQVGHGRLTGLQWIRLTIFDLGIPIMLGAFALWKIGPAIGPFVAALFN